MGRTRAVGSLVAVAAVAAVAKLGASRTTVPPVPPRWPVRESILTAPSSYWSREGFVAMNPPVRPPTSEDGREHIVVYLKLPKDAVIKTHVADAEGRSALEYPVGTAADRVEYWSDAALDAPPEPSWRVADVRGTTIEAGGQVFHVYEPTAESESAPLLGINWPAGDGAVQEEATRALLDLVQDGRALPWQSGASRESLRHRLRSLNDCTSCHTPGRPERTTAGARGAIHRGTDASGFFQVSTVLTDRVPLETYRPNNANANDPFIRVVCGDDETPAVGARGDDLGAVRCKGGEAPVGILDMSAALLQRDPHAIAVCTSRRLLYGHLDSAGQRLYAPAMDECNSP